MMDARLAISRDDLYNLQMEVKQVQYSQNSLSERLLRLEKRNTDDAAIKSVWNSPFPGVLGGTPNQGPVQIPHSDVFDDMDEQNEQLLGSLHLGPAEEEPVRRGAASRANSVRFDESALHGSSWGGQSNRHSGDFGSMRPGLLMERTLSHKSDGRHSSAGHSVHSHHSVPSGRASSVGPDGHYGATDDESSSFEIPGPPASLFVLGTVPSIIRCWLSTDFSHGTLLYADICTGSQKSVVDISLIEELQLSDEIERDADGIYRARLNVYLAEAVVTRHDRRNSGVGGAVPAMSAVFEVANMEQAGKTDEHKGIRIYVGSDALRAHSADILFSQNTMVLVGNERERLRVPFVRPEDEESFRHIYTTNLAPNKPKLNANATPFVFGDGSMGMDEDHTVPQPALERGGGSEALSPTELKTEPKRTERQEASDKGTDQEDGNMMGTNETDSGEKQPDSASETSQRDKPASAGIWGSWRHSGNGVDGALRETASLSGYQPAGRSSRGMKVLKPLKSSARTGSSYEPPIPSRAPGDGRRKSQASINGDAGAINRWDAKRSASSGAELKATESNGRDNQKNATLPRSANPVGVASAFSWMAPTTKSSKLSTADDG